MHHTVIDSDLATLLMVFPETWLDRRSFEWRQLSDAACQAGFTTVITHWNALVADGARIRAREARVRDPVSGVIRTRRDVGFRPDVFLTTWGVDRPFRDLFGRIIADTGAIHKESPTLARLDDKAELERCIRRYERESGRVIPRPRTLLSDEVADNDRIPGKELLILKPARGGKRRGIQIIARSRIVSLAQQAVDEGQPFVAQELIDSDLLHEGRRWVMRVHAMCTSLHPLRYRLYRDGWATTAPEAVVRGSSSLDQWLNPAQESDGTTRATVVPLSRMLDYVQQNYVGLSDFWIRMDGLVRDLFQAIKSYDRRESGHYGDAERRIASHAFLFPGLDLIARRQDSDDRIDLRLLELNSHPGLGDSPETASAMLPYYRRWFDDLFDLVKRRRLPQAGSV